MTRQSSGSALLAGFDYASTEARARSPALYSWPDNEHVACRRIPEDVGMGDAARSFMLTALAAGRVLLISRSDDTPDTLRRDLAEAGIRCEAQHVVNPLSEPSDAVRAVVIFADDFREVEAATYLAILRARRPHLGIVVVTQSAPTYATMHGMDGRPLGAIVLAPSAVASMAVAKACGVFVRA